MPRSLPEKFQVAFSFAGEQRELVREIAAAVEQALGDSNVFFDEWYEHYLGGQEADLKLQDIYGERCELVVVFVSKRYGEKPWTRTEHEVVRARYMKARQTGDELCVLPIRVGEGDVDGIPFNAIVPDFRSRSASDAAQLITDRLHLILGGDTPTKTDVADWPEQPPAMHWPIADHSSVREKLEQLFTRQAPWRFLPLSGPSESGKSSITRQILGNALRIPDLACGRFDFKGTTDMDAELRVFIQQLEVPMPPESPRLNERLNHVLDSLKKTGRPALLIFDTYEAVGEAEEWIERTLLSSLLRATQLRVVIAGQRVPKIGGTIWEPHSANVIELQSPPPADWFEYGKQHRPGLTLADVETACRLAEGKASLLAQLFGPTN